MVADLNGDGRPDVVAFNGSQGGSTIGVLINAGSEIRKPTSIKLRSTLNPSVFGDVVTLIATVSAKSGNPTGSLLFYDGSIEIGDGTLVAGKASLSISYLAAGSHSLTAMYLGSVKLAPSTSAAVNQVVAGPTTTALTSSALPGHINQSITYTATVTATVTNQFGRTPTGTVTFLDGSTAIGTEALSGGKAALTTSYPALGTHSITAEYSGDSIDIASTSSILTEKIFKDPPEPYPSVVMVTTSGSPSFVGQPVTFTATVTSSYGAIPDGEVVTFYDDPHYTVKTDVASGTTVGGVVTFTTSSLVQKGHAISATYAGDAKFKTASGSVLQTVDQYPTTTTLVPSQNPTDLNEEVRFFITVTSAGGPTPTGQVNVPGLGMVTLSGGRGEVDWPAHGACGKHGFQALYLGDEFSATSRSVAVKEFVICGK